VTQLKQEAKAKEKASSTALPAATIAFIGAGNMACSLIGGLLQQGCAAENLLASDPDKDSLERVAALGNITVLSDNAEAVARADVVLLAVKPQLMSAIVEPLAAVLEEKKPLLISIAAGIPCASLQRWSGGAAPVVRCMPNTPALLRLGATALHASADVSVVQRQLAGEILSAVGETIWVEQERDLDAVTAVSGSGPAYFFLLLEAMQAAGEELGLDADACALLAQQTALGAAQMALQSEVDVAELRRRVTSPNGTTEAAIASFRDSGFSAAVERALRAAHQRSQALAEELG